jgi:hypothetical protein
MRQTISGMVAAVAVMMTAGAAPAMAGSCGGGLFQGSCSPCGYAAPCAPAPVYVAPAPVYSGCYGGCGGWARERLPDPVHQYYYVNQGPTYTGPGNWAPRPVYRESALPVYRHHYRARPYYGAGYRYGYAPRHGMRRHGAMYRHHGYHGHRNRVLRRYY